MKLLVTVREMEAPPRGYGIAWRSIAGDYAVAAPVPLHWCLGVVRMWWLEFKAGYLGEATIEHAYRDGFFSGIRFAVTHLAKKGEL